MGYPISNLRNDFEDINEDNREAIKEYSDALINAIETGDFTEVSNVYNEYKDQLDKVIINAEVLNNFTNYIEDLRNHTIAVKNQVFFCDINTTDDEFDQLYGDLFEGDIVVFTETIDGYTVFKYIKVKQAGSSYKTVMKLGSSAYYIEVTNDNIYSLEDTGESFDVVYHTVAGDYVTTCNSGNYLDISNIEFLNDGDVVSIRYVGSKDKNDYSKTINYIKFNGKFYLVNMKRRGESYRGTFPIDKKILLGRDAVCDFVFSIDGLSKLDTSTVDGNRQGGILIYDGNDNVIEENTTLFISKNNLYDTGWVDCSLPSNTAPYIPNESPGINGGSTYKKSSKPQVRRIGNIVHMRGIIKQEGRGSTSLSFNLPSEIFYPNDEEYFVQHTHVAETINDYDNTPLISLKIDKEGNVILNLINVYAFVNNQPEFGFSTGIALNCNATWFVD